MNISDSTIQALVSRIRDADLKHGPRVAAAELLCDLLYGPRFVEADRAPNTSIASFSLKDRILAVLKEGSKSTNDIFRSLGGQKKRLCRAVRELQEDGLIRREGPMGQGGSWSIV